MANVERSIQNHLETDPELINLKSLRDDLIKKSFYEISEKNQISFISFRGFFQFVENEKECLDREMEILKAKEVILMSSIDDLKRNV